MKRTNQVMQRVAPTTRMKTFGQSLRWLLAAMLLFTLAACAGSLCMPGRDALCAAPLQRADAAGRLQQLDVQFRDETFTALVQIEWQAPADQLQLAAITPGGQTLYQLGYDGQRLHWQTGALPLPLQGLPVLLDFQLAFWPLAALPASWQVREFSESDGAGGQRRVRERWQQGKLDTRVEFGELIVIDHPQQQLQLQIRVLE